MHPDKSKEEKRAEEDGRRARAYPPLAFLSTPRFLPMDCGRIASFTDRASRNGADSGSGRLSLLGRRIALARARPASRLRMRIKKLQPCRAPLNDAKTLQESKYLSTIPSDF